MLILPITVRTSAQTSVFDVRWLLYAHIRICKNLKNVCACTINDQIFIREFID